jgi:hypothetical protein
MTAVLDKIDIQEILTDSGGMIAYDTIDNLSLSNDISLLFGVGVGNALYQIVGRPLVGNKFKGITIKEILGGSAEDVVETDAKYALGVKGLMYTSAIYATSILQDGVAERRSLVDCVLIGFAGGEIGGYFARSLIPIRNARLKPS